jgi:predicted dehydrogenase
VPRELRVGLIGASQIAVRAVVEPAARLDGVHVRALAARDPVRAATFAASHGIPVVHPGYGELLADPLIDAVYVSLHNSAHAPWARAAARAGKHVIVEKPLCLTPEEADGIRAAADATGVHVIEAVMTAGHPWQRRVREIAVSGELGALVHMHTRLGFDGGDATGYRFDPALGGGALRDTASYWLQAVDAVVGLGGAVASGRREVVSSCGVDLASTARLCWPDRPGPGPVATLEATLRRGLVARHELRFERGTVRLGRFLLPALASLPLNLVVVPTGGDRRVEQLAPLRYHDHQLASIVHEIAHGRRGAALDEAAARVALMDAAHRDADARAGAPPERRGAEPPERRGAGSPERRGAEG